MLPRKKQQYIVTTFIVGVFFHYRGCFFHNRGCFFIIVGAFSIEVVCKLVSKILIFQIYNLTMFLPSGGYRALISTIWGKFICCFFQYNDCGGNLWKFLGAFLLVHYFQIMIERVPLTRGYSPYFILGSNMFFSGRDSSF